MVHPSNQDAPVALFFDVDGTIVDSRAAVEADTDLSACAPSPAVCDAFRQLRARGHQAFICTGRTMNLIPASLRALEVAGIICGAGASVYLDGELHFSTHIPGDVIEEAMALLMDLGVEVVLEGNEASVALMRPGAVYDVIAGVPTAHDLAGVRALAPDLAFDKISLYTRDVAALRRAGDFFTSRFDVSDLGMGVSELTMRGVTKGSGIRHAVELLGPGPWRTYGFGDSENDLPMLAAVDVPVAMGNALPQVKAVADYVTGPVEEDGVVSALTHFGLI